MRKLFPHATIIIAAMYLVFFVIDRFNEPMAFVNNRMTKDLLLAMCAMSVVNAVALIRYDRKEARRRRKKRKRSTTSDARPDDPPFGEKY